MGLFGPNRTSVGLDIGAGFVKLAAVGHGGDRPELRRLEVRPIPHGAIVNGEVRETESVVDTIGGLVEEAGVGTREVVTALGGHDVFIKKLRLPRLKGTEADSAIRHEAERHVPFEPGGVQLDFQILGPHGDDPHMEVLLVAARRERVEERVTLLAEAGIGTVVLDVEAFALCNALTHNHPGTAEDLVALVDCGHEATRINVLHGGVPVLSRDHHFGLRGLTESLARDHGLRIDEATGLIRSRDDRLPGLDAAVEEGAGLVATAVERAAAFLRTQHPGMGMGRVFLCGGGACIAAMVEHIGRKVKVETRVANPLEMVAVRTATPGHALLSEAAPLFLLALGLALRTA